MSDIIPVYVVEGDFGNAGGGKILGIFEDKAVADENAKGCGSVNCGGDGYVRPGHAIRTPSGELYLLRSVLPVTLNLMRESLAKKVHEGKDHHPEWEPEWVKEVRNSSRWIAAVRIIRVNTGLGLQKAIEKYEEIMGHPPVDRIRLGENMKSPANALNPWHLTEEDADIIKDVGDPNSPRGKYKGTPDPLDPWEGTEEGDKMLARVLDPNDPAGKPPGYEFNKAHKFVEEATKSEEGGTA